MSKVMSAFKEKTGNPPQDSSRKINSHQRYGFVELINLPITWLIGEPMEA